MRITIKRDVQKAACSSLFLLSALGAAGQGTFQNLSFEDTLFIGPNATVPGWSWSPPQTFGIGDPYTTVAYNKIALDAAAVTLHGTDSPYASALSGNYSIALQGGTKFLPPEYPKGAWISQTGQIPADARSLTYLGGALLQVSFSGQSLSPIVLDSGPAYLRWGVDISSYAGQTGELRFSVPWLSDNPADIVTPLDEIVFSPSAIPEPSALSLSILGFVLVTALTRWANHSRQPTPGDRLGCISASLARRGCALRSA